MMKKRIKFKASGLHLNNSRGFTLIEMISAIVLLGVIGIFSTQFITSITQSAQLTTAQKGLVDDAKLAMEWLVREVRVAVTPIDPPPTATSITFTKFNGYDVDTNPTGITYTWNAGNQTLTRTSGATTTTLAGQVTSFSITVPSTDFYVFTMTLTGPNGENFTLESGVRPRSTTT